MKKRMIGFGLALILGMSSTAHAAPIAAFGDSSKGNHSRAPYAASDIIVPRPEKSAYLPLSKYPMVTMPSDIKGHWAEQQIAYFLNKGIMKTENGKVYPNKEVTYGEFAQVMAGLDLDPVEFCGGSVSYKMFSDTIFWNPSNPNVRATQICAEAGIWGNPSESNYTMTGVRGITLDQKATREYISVFLSNLLPPVSNQNPATYFSDISACRTMNGKETMSQLVDQKIISGFSDHTIRPNATVTRAELAVMIYKVLGKSDFNMDAVSENLYGNYHDYYWNEEARLLNLVNTERKKTGKQALGHDADLNALCEIKMLEKSIYGYDTFEKITQYDGKSIAAGHVSEFYGRATEMAEAFGLDQYLVGENAVKNAPFADKAHKSLTNSPAHRENYLNGKYEKAGFAVGGKLTYELFAYCK